MKDYFSYLHNLLPPLSGVFAHIVFCAYFVRFEGAGVMCRFICCTREDS